jgi:hypothetical protein
MSRALADQTNAELKPLRKKGRTRKKGEELLEPELIKSIT